MAPEIALEECSSLRPGSVVVDPMVGSGTTIHAAAKAGCTAIGTDVDPLAILMSRVRTTPIDVDSLLDTANTVVARAIAFNGSREIASIDQDNETRAFVNFWFAESQQRDLRALSILITKIRNTSVRAALKVALSRLIITKDKGASLGRDVSHSRPHRVRTENDFDVLLQFERTSARLAKVLGETMLTGTANAFLGDARSVCLRDSCADLVITSPPYLNAIDYLRGHRLSLVWLGYSVAHIRRIRGESVGAERGVEAGSSQQLKDMRASLGNFSSLSSRHMRMVDRFLLDLLDLYREQARLLRSGGKAVTVIGNSALRGAFLRNDRAATVAAQFQGLVKVSEHERTLPSERRYLPPPQHLGGAALQQRMRTETILRFAKK
ncbi:hypothetical protein [Plantactinospora sp. CA-290183]|uniref:hypothetical protein n=1 Tax=Plantactinospora sp. CA-290183 TaxID=3240006 RepID=UPI003D9479A5